MRVDPVIIGGTGGSGTTVFAQMLQVQGLDIGELRPQQSEWRPFARFVKEWGVPIVAGDFDKAEARAALEIVLRQHRGRSGAEPWGMKFPQSCLLLDFLTAALPAMKFIHMVRDGRDMSISKNQKQMIKYGEVLLGSADTAPVHSAQLWSETNLRILDQGRSLLGDRYVVVRFEDLYDRPDETLERTAVFIGLQPNAPQLTAAVELLNRNKPGVGRSLELAADELRAITEVAEPGLRAFAYL